MTTLRACPLCRFVVEPSDDCATLECPGCAEDVEVSQLQAPTEQELGAYEQTSGARRGGANSSRADAQVVMDVVAGVNLRKKDNLYQAVAILACMAMGAAVGAFVTEPVPGMIAGLVIGMIVGTFGSGIFLMFYRMFRH